MHVRTALRQTTAGRSKAKKGQKAIPRFAPFCTHRLPLFPVHGENLHSRGVKRYLAGEEAHLDHRLAWPARPRRVERAPTIAAEEAADGVAAERPAVTDCRQRKEAWLSVCRTWQVSRALPTLFGRSLGVEVRERHGGHKRERWVREQVSPSGPLVYNVRRCHSLQPAVVRQLLCKKKGRQRASRHGTCTRLPHRQWQTRGVSGRLPSPTLTCIPPQRHAPFCGMSLRQLWVAVKVALRSGE